MYKHLFGPIPSRRLGVSLGVDLVTHKTCSLDCIYCESGATTNLTMQRREYVAYAEVKSELLHYFAHNEDPDYITFSGGGEPTLSSCIGRVIDFIKGEKPEVKVAVLTNGTLLSDPVLRRELSAADLVVPSLDGAVSSSFMRINRPDPDIDLDKYIQGIRDFRAEFSGQLALEILILPGVNDDDENIDALREICADLNADTVQLNTLDRPGVVRNIRPATVEELEAVARRLGCENIVIPSSAKSSKKKVVELGDLGRSVLEIVQRRPCTVADLLATIDCSETELRLLLGELVIEDKLVIVEEGRGEFYRIA